MIKEEYKYSDITEKIIGSALEVHKLLNGFTHLFNLFLIGIRECFAVQERALAIEFEIQKLSYEREKEIPVFYKEYYQRERHFLLEPGCNKFIMPSSSWKDSVLLVGVYIEGKQVLVEKVVKE